MSAEIRQMMKSTTTDAFWQMLRASEPQAPDDYRLLWFGGTNVALATELADLVVDGPKRATTTLVRDFEPGRSRSSQNLETSGSLLMAGSVRAGTGEWRAGQGRNAEHSAKFLSRFGDGPFTVMMEQPLKRCR
jgi:hypothetical protein